MAAASCCLNRLPPPSISSSAPNHSSPFAAAPPPWFKSDKLRSNCMVGVACLVIGLETGTDLAMAVQDGGMNYRASGDVVVMVGVGEKSLPKWSDKRMCPAWQLNSLETIVPENLPRPSARRRSESADFATGTTNDHPPAAGGRGGVVRRSSRSCFSM